MMQQLLTAILNSIFPPRESERRVQKFSTNPTKLSPEPELYETTIYVAKYADPDVQACIIENKFHHNKAAAKILGKLISHWTDARDSKILFIPIPLSAEREKTRGHNQTTSILKQVSTPIKINTTLLSRQCHTTPQTQLRRTERIKNMNGAFQYNEQNIEWSEYDEVVIFDDVVTTGTTLTAAEETMRPHIPSNMLIITLAVAH
jgi:ComF family protein